MTLSPNTPVSELSSVGKTTAGRLARLGIHTARDLLWNIPRTHEDLSEIRTIAEIESGTKCTVRATITEIQVKRTPRKRMFLTEALVHDATGELKIIWFNQPYIAKQLQSGDDIYLSGEVKQADLLLPQMTNPTYERAGQTTTHTARIVPHYHLTANLTQKQLRFLITQVLPLAESETDTIPPDMQKQYGLVPIAKALRDIHFPEKFNDFKQAQYRLKFEELLYVLLQVEIAKQDLAHIKAPRILFNETVIKQFVSALPFTLTQDQKKAAWSIMQDMEQTHPMNRLLEGDVGSGKTIVALLATLNTITNDQQVVIMAPTEILARQHFATFTTMLSEYDHTIALLTRTDQQTSTSGAVQKSTRKAIQQAVTKNAIQIIVGTHALLHQDLNFHSLALIIIDEQHRFGVQQRQQLKDTTPDLTPHFLSMTATPIPRSLALTLYGDLNISLIKEKPKNRKPIITKLIDANLRDAAYAMIRKEVANGNQAFVICPLVEESDKLGVKAATQEYGELQNIFPDLTLGLVHGKLKKQDNEQVMHDFKNKKIDILVATAVVEVGVDIPDATIMIIEGAERFGLAQLHQFRGRIGRSDKQSYCLLFTNSTHPETKQRLNLLVKHGSGFELSEHDLKLRGPGDLCGYKQSGLPPLSIASLADMDIMVQAKQAAKNLLQTDNTLATYPEIQNKLQTLQPVHFE